MTPTEIPTPDMPADGAARYRVIVAEAQRMAREVEEHRAARVAVEAENRHLRAALGLCPGVVAVKPGTVA